MTKAKNDKEDLKELLIEYEDSLLRIQQRAYLIEEVEKCLDNKTEGDTFSIKNTVIWQMYFDSYDMLVNDLTSFIKSLKAKNGFFNRLQHFSKFLIVPGKENIKVPKGSIRSVNHKLSREELNKIENDLNKRYINEAQAEVRHALEFLFPRIKNIIGQNIRLNPSDFNDLKKRYSFDNHPLVKYRNQTSGHRYENKHIIKSLKNGPTIEELRTIINSLEGLFNQLRMSFERSTFGYRDMSFFPTQDIAEDIANMILLGPQSMVMTEYLLHEHGQEKYYSKYLEISKLHENYWKEIKIKAPK